MPPQKKNTPANPVAVDSLKHKSASRKNIPTEELRDFVADEEQTPKTLRYPRNPDLDPQLVWQGKDEQDSQDLEVPVVPVYIQEKIHPQAIIEDVRAAAKKGQPGTLDMFSDFNGLDFEQMIEFYQHDQRWQNRMILGDSLLVMTSLAEKEGLKGQVQMIYLDPPYGIRFNSNWQVSTRKRDVKDGKAEDATRQPEQIKAFRDTWELGIHSYLAYLRDRLTVARDLLTETGSVFVQIGDENVHLVRCLMDEVFGDKNFISDIVFLKTSGAGSPAIGTDTVAGTYDCIIWYAKKKELVKYRQPYREKALGDEGTDQYRYFEDEVGRRGSIGQLQVNESQRAFRYDQFTSQTGAATTQQPIMVDGREYQVAKGGWKTNALGAARLIKANRLAGIGKTLTYVRYLNDFPAFPINNFWSDTRQSGFGEEKTYVVQTAPKVIQRCLLMTTDPGDLVLDPTCGSGTTAYVAEQWGRRWITIDTSRVALALARTRLMAARYPYYLLADSEDGIKKQAELTGKLPPADIKPQGDIKQGFVYKTVPHITLKSIANNPEIDEIHAQWQSQLEPVRAELNALLQQQWEDWQVPREAQPDWPPAARDRLTRWWELRRQRQAEIDAAIARNADPETLYDQPYEDKKRIRVTGPFTVESLSPHRVLPTSGERPAAETTARDETAAGQFEVTILDNLRKAGVQNTKRNERLQFDRLEPYAGAWIHAEGEFTDQDGKVKRVAVSIGPEHGTVGPEQIKEAVRGVGSDLLTVCGFAFDPHVAEEAKRYGKLTVLPTRMNPDLAMGEALLKKTGTGNLFMVFGEPDIQPLDPKTGRILPRPDGKIQIEIQGVDIYDPTTGQIRSNSTDDIACWFIDTHYNGESFFVRHAYFTGAGDPYDKLRRALRAEIDEAAWAELYSTRSRPFDPPETGKIAVKVINHYGDEVLKVFEV